MSKFSLSTAYAANDVGIPADRLSRLYAFFAHLGSNLRTEKAAVTVTLAKGRLHRVTKPSGRLVTCTSGAIWLTFYGEIRDIVLEAGESFHCGSRSRLLIFAFEAATVQIA